MARVVSQVRTPPSEEPVSELEPVNEDSFRFLFDRIAVTCYLEALLDELKFDVQSIELVGAPNTDPDPVMTTYLILTFRNGACYPEGNGFPKDGEDPRTDALWDLCVDLQERHRKDLAPYAYGLPFNEPILVSF